MRQVVVAAVLLLLVLPVDAGTVLVEAARDATLIEDPEGAWANGSGPFLFAGKINAEENGIRRGLLYFDVAAALPRGAIVESVSLQMFESGRNPRPAEVRLHRVQAEWGEGPSSSSGGGGARSGPGDATWIHTFFDDELWVRRGGQFPGRASATQEVGAGGFYTWESTVHLVQDVRLWSSNPRRNFGWIAIGDEATAQNVKKFASRENNEPAIRPRLEIRYRMPGEGSARHP